MLRGLVLLWLFICFAFGCQQKPAPEVLLSQARELVASGNYEKAYRMLLPLKELIPDDPELWYQLGLVEIYRGRPYEAIRSLETALDLDRKNPRILVKLGYLYLITGYYQRAESLAQELQRIDPDNIYALLILGNLKALSGQLDQAEALFKEAMEKRPSDFRCYLELGDFYLLKGELRRAEVAYLKAREMAPDRPEVYMALGNLYRHEARPRRAEEAYQKMVDLAPSEKARWRYLAYLADFYLVEGSAQKALSIYQKIYAQVGVNDYDLAVRLAEVALYVGDLELAEGVIKALSRAYPQNFAAPYLEGHLCLMKGDYGGAVFSFNQVVVINEDERGLYYLGLSQWLAGYHKQAKATLARALEINPLSYRSRFLMVLLEIADGKTPPASGLLPLFKIPDLLQEAHYLLVVDLIRKKDCPLVEAEVGVIEALYPEAPATRLLKLAYMVSCGRKDRARQELRALNDRIPVEALALWGDFPEEILGLSALRPSSQTILASHLLRSGRLDEAEFLLKAAPERPSLLYLKALVSIKKEAYQEAEGLLKQILLEVPDFAPAAATLGDLCWKRGQRTEALNYYRQAVKYAPEEPIFLNNLAWALLEAGHLEEARLWAEKAVSFAPQEPAILDTLGWVYFHLDMKEAARGYLRQAHSLAPEDKAIKNHLLALEGKASSKGK
ncbi:tetratricopeptide repeat protein [Thermosulfuriphilus sp.]